MPKSAENAVGHRVSESINPVPAFAPVDLDEDSSRARVKERGRQPHGVRTGTHQGTEHGQLRAGPTPARQRMTANTSAPRVAVTAPATTMRRADRRGRTAGAPDDVSASANWAAVPNRSAGA